MNKEDILIKVGEALEIIGTVEEQNHNNINVDLAIEQDNVINEVYAILNEIE
jgi:hypothetical protein